MTGGHATLDLGGRKVELRTWGLAHTRGDQVVWLPDGAHPVHRRPRGGAHLSDLSVVPARTTPTSMARAGRRSSASSKAGSRAIVVPGHGDVGGAEILVAVRDYMVDLGGRVAAERKAGKDSRRDRG